MPCSDVCRSPGADYHSPHAGCHGINMPIAIEVARRDTIKLTVSVKQGGGSGDRIWDVRVGSAVLANGFEVLK